MRKLKTVWRILLVLELALLTLATARQAKAETYIGDIIKVTSTSGSDCYYQFAIYMAGDPLVEKVLVRQNSGSCNLTWEVTANGLCMTRSTNPSQTNFCDSAVSGYNTWSYSSYDSGWNTQYGAPNTYYMSFTPSNWSLPLSAGFRVNAPGGGWCDVFGTGDHCTIHIQGAQTYTLTRPDVPLGPRGNLQVWASSSECTTAIVTGSEIQVDPGCVLSFYDVANPTYYPYTICQGPYYTNCTNDPYDLQWYDSGEYGLVYINTETPELASDGCVIAYDNNGYGYDEIERYDISAGSSGDEPVEFEFNGWYSTPDYFEIVLNPGAGQPACW